KVVPGNIHPPEERRTGVIVSPARLAVVAAVVVNAEMGPAIWVPGIGGLVPAQGATPIPVDPDCEPSLGWLVVQNNRVAKGIGERTLAARGCNGGEGQSAVGRNRCAGELVGVRASGVVESNDNLVRVIRISISVCLRLNNMRRGLGASNQVHVRTAKAHRCHEVVHKLGERTGTAEFGLFAASLRQTAVNHDRSGSEAFHPSDAKLANLRTIKSRWNKRADLLRPGANSILVRPRGGIATS